MAVLEITCPSCVGFYLVNDEAPVDERCNSCRDWETDATPPETLCSARAQLAKAVADTEPSSFFLHLMVVKELSEQVQWLEGYYLAHPEHAAPAGRCSKYNDH